MTTTLDDDLMALRHKLRAESQCALLLVVTDAEDRCDVAVTVANLDVEALDYMARTLMQMACEELRVMVLEQPGSAPDLWRRITVYGDALDALGQTPGKRFDSRETTSH